MYYRIYYVNLLARSIKARADCFSAKFSNLAQARLTCKVLCFALSIKRKTLATFFSCCSCCLYYVCESLMRSRGVCLHIYLGLSRIKIMSRAWWSFNCCIKSLKIHKRECLYLLWIKERSCPWTWSYHVIMIISFLLKVAIGC